MILSSRYLKLKCWSCKNKLHNEIIYCQAYTEQQDTHIKVADSWMGLRSRIAIVCCVCVCVMLRYDTVKDVDMLQFNGQGL